MVAARDFAPGSSARRALATSDATAVADAQAVEAGLHHRLMAFVVESNANEIDVLPLVRFADLPRCAG
jgi:hypothetical protein